MGAIGRSEFQNVFFDFGFIDQCIAHGVVFLFGFCGVAIGIECRKTLVECLGIVCREELSDFGRENDDRNGIIQLLCDFFSGFHWCGGEDSPCYPPARIGGGTDGMTLVS